MSESPEPSGFKVRERPYKRYGVTVSQPTPWGTVHVTMNQDAEGRPFEVFVKIGKGGSDLMAMAEAMGRLMSLVLRLESPVPPEERVREIIDQIRRIGGEKSQGFGRNKVRSLPDAVGLALEEHYFSEDDLSFGRNETQEDNSQATLCPECGMETLLPLESRLTCESCGYVDNQCDSGEG